MNVNMQLYQHPLLNYVATVVENKLTVIYGYFLGFQFYYIDLYDYPYIHAILHRLLCLCYKI
jgi:hypothetical protein